MQSGRFRRIDSFKASSIPAGRERDGFVVVVVVVIVVVVVNVVVVLGVGGEEEDVDDSKSSFKASADDVGESMRTTANSKMVWRRLSR